MPAIRLPVTLIVAAGVVVGANVGKLPPALPLLREQLGMSLVQASFLLSLYQSVGMLLALFGGMIADRVGPRRVMLAGLATTALGSAAGGLADTATTLLASRAIESAGFILTVLPAPAMIARTVDAVRLRLVLGIWSAYMPTGMAAALALAPLAYEAGRWRSVWWIVAAAAVLVAAGVATRVAPDPPDAARRAPGSSLALVRDTVTAPRPWLLALAFGCYSSQWIGMFGFLPTALDEAGVAPALAGTLTAIGAAVNVSGNLMSGVLLQRGVSRSALLVAGSLSMILGAYLCFGTDAPLSVRFAGVLLFSSMGGLIPGTLFASTSAYAPHAGAVSTTTGLMQQGSSLGQFAFPPVVASVAAASGGWHGTWIATGVLGVAVIALAVVFSAQDRRTV